MDKLGSYKIQIIAIVAVLFFFALVLRLILRGKLRTEYSFIWILMGGIFLVFSVWRDLLDVMATSFGVFYAPSLIFIFFFFMIFVFLIHLSVVNSKQHEEIKKLTQEIALIKQKLSEEKK